MTRYNPNPYDGEAYYNLGRVLKWQGRLNEAYAEKLKLAEHDYNKLIRGDVHNALAAAQDYAMAGLYEEAVDVLIRF